MIGMIKMELISVIMPSYNTPYEYLRSAVDSIRNQSYDRFELLIIDDGSTEYNDTNVWNNIIDGDSRIRIIKNTHKKGVAGALNTGIDSASGKYIIRMDADDISMPDRLMCQVDYLENHPETDLLAGYIKCFGATNKIEKSEIDDVAIKTTLLFQSGIAHPTVCLRKETIDRFNLRYDEDIQSEDYDLWIKCAQIANFKFSTLPQIVLNYRVHDGQVSQTRKRIMISQGRTIRSRYIKSQTRNITEKDISVFVDYSMYLSPKVGVLKLISIEKSICEDITKKYVASSDQKKCKKVFWKICIKKALMYIKRGKIEQVIAMLFCIFNFIAS